MKKIIKINYLTYFFILSACLTGMFKECLILMTIVILHEFGHVITIKYFSYQFLEIELFPFGGVTKIKKDLNSPINHELIISVSGILMQLVLFIILSFLYHNNIFDSSLYNLFNKYNFSILIFNLLPIIPLDGSIFLRSLLEKAFSFKNANIFSIIISFLILIIFFYINYLYELNNYIIGVFLLYKIILYIKNYKYLKNKFLLERYLNNYNFKKVKEIKSVNEMAKEKIHYIRKNNRIIKEKDILKNYFRC